MQTNELDFKIGKAKLVKLEAALRAMPEDDEDFANERNADKSRHGREQAYWCAYRRSQTTLDTSAAASEGSCSSIGDGSASRRGIRRGDRMYRMRQRVFLCHRSRLRLPSIRTVISITIHSICTHVRSTFLRFFQLIISSSLERHISLFCAILPTLHEDFGLLPPPHSEPTSMTLCVRLHLSQAPQPGNFLCWNNLFVPSSVLSSQAVQCARTATSSLQSTFHHHIGTCVSPCSFVRVWPISSCEILHFHQAVLEHRSSFSACGPTLRANVHIVYK